MSRLIRSRIQEVLPGTQEYFIYGQALSSDTNVDLEIIFDQGFMIEDIVLNTILDGGTSISAGPLKIIYPSENEMVISSSVSDYVLNQNDDSRKLWYPIPAWSKLRWTPYNQYVADVIIGMTVIGRGI